MIVTFSMSPREFDSESWDEVPIRSLNKNLKEEKCDSASSVPKSQSQDRVIHNLPSDQGSVS